MQPERYSCNAVIVLSADGATVWGIFRAPGGLDMPRHRYSAA